MKALIFDFDGLILDTEVPIYEAWKENYAAYEQELSLPVYCGCVGSDHGSFDPKSHLEELTGQEIDWERWDSIREERAMELVSRLEPMPGVERLLIEAEVAGVPCAVASSSPRSWVGPHLERVGLTRFFRLTRCLDDVGAPKPAPDLFLSAAQGLAVRPGEALVLEDSRNGLDAAIAAGIPCVSVPNAVTASLDFSGAMRILKDGLGDVSLADLETWVSFHVAGETA